MLREVIIVQSIKNKDNKKVCEIDRLRKKVVIKKGSAITAIYFLKNDQVKVVNQ